MVIPTLLVKGSLNPTSDKVTKEQLDEYIAIHWILGLLEYKWKKPNPNIHDRIFLLKSLVGSGKTTVFIVETFRKFFNRHPYNLEYSKSFKTPVNFDYSIFDYPDDEYTIENRKNGITPIKKIAHKILCSQPKVVLAKSKAEEIAGEDYNPDLELMENVGYTTGPAKHIPVEDTHILYCTMGSLKETMRNKSADEIMQQYEMIAIDECHERSLELDEGSAYIREFLHKCAGNPACPMIVYMSATFDIKKYATYLGTNPSNSVLVEGGAASRDFFYLDKPANNVYKEAAELAMKLHKENTSDTDTYNDILIFAPGGGEIKVVVSELKELDTEEELFITMITSEVVNAGGQDMKNIEKKTLDQVREEYKRPGIKRRVTVATNVVETGLTIKTLKYVIDTCMAKGTLYSPVHNLPSLLTQPASMSSLEQRGGRAGRIQYGYIYRMMTEASLSQLSEYAKPDIFTTDLAKVQLNMLYVGIDEDQIIKPLSNEMFDQFLKDCFDEFGFKLTNKTENCKCIYNTILEKDKVPEEKKFIGEFKLKTYPEEMLDKLATDTYICARNKLITLGFYGTYIGYLASKVSRLSVEATRMVMAGLVYGISINDLITIGIFVDTGKKDYIYNSQIVKRMQMREKDKSLLKFFSSDRLMESVIKKSTLKKHFGGDVRLLKNQLYDEFLEPLMVMKWYAKVVREIGPIKAIDEAKKMGINLISIYKFMDCRAQIQESFKKIGIISTRHEVDFNSDQIFDDIIRIKKCIHAGYKNNLAYLLSGGPSYVTNTGLKITPTNLGKSFKPKKIIFGCLLMRAKNQSKYYQANPTYITSMDGII